MIPNCQILSMILTIKNEVLDKYNIPISSESFEVVALRIQPVLERNKTQDFRPSWKIFLNHDVDVRNSSKITYDGMEYSVMKRYPVSELDGTPAQIEIWI